jgi:hypothetical protein
MADRIEALADEIIAATEDLTDDQWIRVAQSDGRTVNVIVDHISQSAPAVYMLVEMIAAGQSLPALTMQDIHDANGQHAAERASVTKEEALVGLRVNLESTAAKVRQLDDSLLDTEVAFTFSESGTISPDAIIRHIIIGHSEGHLADITASVG